MASGTIQVIWSTNDVATVSISGDTASWTVDGVAVTFPYYATTTTSFVTTTPGRHVISVLQNGQEIASTPDGTLTVELRGDQTFAFAPSPDNVDVAISRLDREDGLASGEATFSRHTANSSGTMTSGALRLAFKRASKTESIGSIIVPGGGTAAGATPTLIRVGVYEENPNTGLFTLVASSANDTTKFSSASTGAESTFTLSAPFTKVRGRRYGVGALVVTGATAPTALAGSVISAIAAVKSPRLCAALTGLADLPATISAATLNSNGSTVRPYIEFVPAA